MLAKIQTNHGLISVELDEKAAPLTCENFRQYAADGHFDNTIFHRVIPGFMIQGGGFTAEMSQKPTRDNIKNEANNGLKNVTGSIAMARTPDPHSASSQFFINLKDNDFLDFSSETDQGWGYCVFGQTVDGLDAVNSIAAAVTGPHGHYQDVPIDTVLIESVVIED